MYLNLPRSFPISAKPVVFHALNQNIRETRSENACDQVPPSLVPNRKAIRRAGQLQVQDFAGTCMQWGMSFSSRRAIIMVHALRYPTVFKVTQFAGGPPNAVRANAPIHFCQRSIQWPPPIVYKIAKRIWPSRRSDSYEFSFPSTPKSRSHLRSANPPLRR